MHQNVNNNNQDFKKLGNIFVAGESQMVGPSILPVSTMGSHQTTTVYYNNQPISYQQQVSPPQFSSLGQIFVGGGNSGINST